MLKRWLLALLTPVPLLGLLGLPRYMVQWYSLRSTRRARLPLRDSYPCLTDWVHSTPFDPHYFFQAGWRIPPFLLNHSRLSAHPVRLIASQPNAAPGVPYDDTRNGISVAASASDSAFTWNTRSILRLASQFM